MNGCDVSVRGERRHNLSEHHAFWNEAPKGRTRLFLPKKIHGGGIVHAFSGRVCTPLGSRSCGFPGARSRKRKKPHPDRMRSFNMWSSLLPITPVVIPGWSRNPDPLFGQAEIPRRTRNAVTASLQ